MYLGVGPVFVIILMLLFPIVWAVWWFLAELGDRTSGAHPTHHQTAPASP